MQASKKILVTGGAGYIGAHTCIALHAAGYTPVILDNFSNTEPFMIQGIKEVLAEPLSVYEGDCRDAVLLDRIAQEQGPLQGIIHFAAYKSVGQSVKTPFSYYDNNLRSTITLLEFVERHQVPQLVFSSSCTVYGEPDQLPISEVAVRKEAVSPYGNTKRVCEDLIHDFLVQDSIKDLPSEPAMIILRYFNPVGAHPSGLIGEIPEPIPNFLVPYVLKAAMGTLKELTVFGSDYDTQDGTAVRDYIHVMDLAEAHVQALAFAERQNKLQKPEVFNIGTGRGSTVLEVISAFEEATGVQVPHKIGARRPGDISASYADATKAMKLLGWQAKRSLLEAMRDAWRWQQRYQEITTHSS